jgi:hypothetical protein
MNRETWLKQLADRAIPYIAGRFNYTEEEVAVRLSCGFPATQGKRKKVTASLIPPTNSDEFNAEIFVTPEIDTVEEVARAVLPLLVAVVIGDYKQGTAYRNACHALYLNTDGERLPSWALNILEHLPHYPHASVTLPEVKKQTTRLLKVECVPCNYIARVSRATLDRLGTPVCPACRQSFTESI